LRESDFFEQRHTFFVGFGLRQLLDFYGRESYVLQHGFMRKKIERLEHHSHFEQQTLIFFGRRFCDGRAVFAVQEQLVLDEDFAGADWFELI